MSISELFNTFQEEFKEDELRGEFVLQGNVMIWSYNLSADDEDEFDCIADNDEDISGFEIECDEELLLEAYHEDIEKVKLFLDELNETENWNFSEHETVDDVILFKLF
jgi:hypothetical protein